MACCSSVPARSRPLSDDVQSVTDTALIASLAANAAKRLAIDCPDRPINAGFHVTEVKLAQVSSLDCGRGRAEWQEIIIQIMDIPESDDLPLTAGKFAAIVQESLRGTAIANAAFIIELSNGQDALRLYDVDVGFVRKEEFVARLSPRRARCKAASRTGRCGVKTDAVISSVASSKTACCG